MGAIRLIQRKSINTNYMKRQAKKVGNLMYQYINGWTEEEWLAYRSNGIGGSDIASILGLNPYKCATEVFYEKIGLHESRETNMAMFMGNYFEDSVANLWKYWEEVPQSILFNHSKKRKVRDCQRVNAYIHNPKYPQLMASIDRRIVGKQKGILECKTISGYASKKWETGIPPMYVCQLQQYLLVTELDYGEMAILKDGRDFQVYPFVADKEIQERIIQASKQFWTKVTAAKPIARQLLREYEREIRNEQKITGLENMLRKLEPKADGNPAYEQFMKARYKEPTGVREGTEDELEAALQYKKIIEREKQLEAQKQLKKNELISILENTEQLDFGDKGKVTFKVNKKGSKVLRVSVQA